MEENLDLRPYFEALVHYWYIIVIGIVLGAVIGLGIKLALPKSYEATALVAVTVPRQFVLESLTQDDVAPQLTSVEEGPLFLKVYPELATSDDVLQRLLDSLNEKGLEIETITALQRQLKAEPGADPTLVRLRVKDVNPQRAALIANSWADVYVPWVNQVYGNQGETQVQFFNDQLISAETELATNEERLIEFQSQNLTNTIRNTLSIYNQLQADYLAEQQKLNLLAEDVAILQKQLRNQSGNSDSVLAHQLTALGLQLQAYNTKVEMPLNIQIDETAMLTGVNVAGQLAFLDSLSDVVTSRKIQIEAELTDIEPQILALQQQLEEAKVENARLERSRNEAQEAYTALVRKVAEERITAQDTGSGVRLASQAGIPMEPVSISGLLLTVVGAAVGFFLSLFIVFALELWPREDHS